MKRFTDSIRKSIAEENWFAALFMALCLPDICGSLETPSEGVGKRYERWFNDNLAAVYAPMFTAQDCYYFRCACLHQGLDTHAKIASERIHFITPPPRNNVVHRNKFNDVLQMQINIFCEDMAQAVDEWAKRVADDKEIQGRISNLISIYDVDSLRPFIAFG